LDKTGKEQVQIVGKGAYIGGNREKTGENCSIEGSIGQICERAGANCPIEGFYRTKQGTSGCKVFNRGVISDKTGLERA
jgi:hypothetical protein